MRIYRRASQGLLLLILVVVSSSHLALAAPSISAASPSYGPSGTPVTIAGTNFGATQGTSTVTFIHGTSISAQVTSWSNTSIGVIVPSTVGGPYVLKVVVAGVASNTNISFSVMNPQTYSTFPAAGIVGTAVTIWGINFGTAQGTSTVSFGGIPAQTTNWTDNSIGVVVPPGVPNGTTNIQVTVGGLSTNTQTFTVSPNPFISFLSQNAGPVDSAITINGVNFGQTQGASTVTFNGLASVPLSWSDTSIVVQVPVGAVTGNVVVKVAAISSNGIQFLVTSPQQQGGVGFVQGNYSVISDFFILDSGQNTVHAQCFQDRTTGLFTSIIYVPYPLIQNQGNLNVVVTSWRDTNPDVQTIVDFTPSGGPNNSYYIVTDTTQNGNGHQRMYFASNIVGRAQADNPQNSVVITFGSNTGNCVQNPEVRIAEYKGLSTAAVYGALDISVSRSSSGTATCDSSAVTTTNAYDFLVGADLPGKPTTAAGTGYSNRLIASPFGESLEDRLVTTTGSYKATATMSAASTCIMQMLAFKEAPNQAPSVNAGPSQSTTLPVNSVTLNGSVSDDGLPNNTLTISWSKVSGPGTVTFSSPSSENTQSTFSAAGTYVLQLTANDSQLASTANVTVIVNPEPISIVLSPLVAGPNVKGTTQTMTAVVKIANTGAPITGAGVQFSVAGANVTTSTINTNANGAATFTYTGANNGNDTVQASYGGQTSNIATVSWITPVQAISTGTILGRFYSSDGSNLIKFTSTTPPVFTMSFPNINFNPPSGSIPGNTSGVDVNTRPFTDITTDINGTFTGTIVAQGNGLQAGMNSLFNFQAAFTGVFTVASAGDATIKLFSDDGFFLGVGNGATGSNNDPPSSLPSVTPLNSLPVIAGFNSNTNPPLASTIVVHFPAAGSYPYELDYQECCGGSLALNMTVGQTSSSGLAPTGSLVLTPINPSSMPAGQTQTLTVQATDGGGQIVANTPVSLIISGGSVRELTGTTDSTGRATFQYTSTNAGTDLVEAVATISSMGAYSNVVKVPWTVPVGGGGGTVTLVTQGWIGSPLVGAAIQNQVPITVASGVTLTSGTLTYWPTSNPQAVTTLSSNTTGSGTIGTIDGTTLTNGGYTIQLIATASNGSTQKSQIVVAVVGDNKPGRMTATVTEFTVPLAGIPITITRSYDSLDRSKAEDFGFGWKIGTFVDLQVDLLKNVTFNFNGQRQTFFFTPQSNGNFLFPWLLLPTYTPQAGLHGTLKSDGCSALLQVQNDVVCFSGGTYQPTTYTYTDPIGRIYTIAATGQLQSIKDLNGNTLTITPSGITSSVNGVVVPFVRDPQNQNRITQITDLNGNPYVYSYDPTTGDLTSVQYPGLTAPTTYTYFSDHSLKTEVDPRGNTSTATYYPDGRIQSVSDKMQPPNVWQYAYTLSTNTTTITNPDGGTITRKDDNSGKPLTITEQIDATTSRTTTYRYDTSENLLGVTDPLHNPETVYTYDSNGFQTSIKDPLGNKSVKLYNQFGGVTTDTDAANTNTITTQYDNNFNPYHVTDLQNGTGTQVETRTFDSLGNVLTRTDGNNKTTQYDYDPVGNLIKVTDALNEVTLYGYDAMGRIKSKTDPLQHTTQYDYDALGRLKTITDANHNQTKYDYDNNGNKISETDANNHQTTFQYDNNNRLKLITYPTTPATTRSSTYDFRGNKLTEGDQAGNVTKYVYDLAGQLSSVTYGFGTADAGTVQYTYDLDGSIKTVTDELNNKTINGYDAAERLITVTDAQNRITTYGPDSDNRAHTAQDANGNTVTYDYYPRGWLKTITYPAAPPNPVTTTQYTYDGMGRVLTTTDQANKLTTKTYDDIGRLATVTDALNNITRYSYDLAGNLKKIRDANLHDTTFQYDNLNRRIMRTLPLQQFETMSYDAVGNLSAKTDFNFKTTIYAYDEVNRLKSKLPDSSLNQPTISFMYTPTGRRASMTDASGTTNYTVYDSRDRLKTKVTPEGTLNYTYDAHGNLMSIASSNANGASISYTYDTLNRLATAKDNRVAAQGGPSTAAVYTYDPVGNLTSYTAPNLVKTGYVPDQLNRLTQICTAATTSSSVCSVSPKLSSFTYTFGNAGNRTNVLELSGRNVAYGYDDNYRLTSEAITADPGGRNGTVSYTNYDAVGNRKTMTSTLSAVPGGTFSYDANDQLSIDTYDNSGNTVSSGGITNSYDFENRLLTHGAVNIVYDGDGNRVSETAGGVTTKYLVDELNPTGLTQVLDETVNGSPMRTYAYGLQRIDENQLIGGIWTPSFYGYDDHANVRFLFNAAGSVTDTYQYDAFGNQIASTGTTPNNFLYSGEQFDSSLGSYYFRARYYRTPTGRFLTMDHTSGVIRDPLSLHRYLYSRNDPVDRIDPTGCADAIEEGSIGRYNSLVYRRWITGTGKDLEFHHIIPKRFACLFGLAEGAIIAIALPKDVHQFFDNEWARWPELEGEPCSQALQDVVDAALEIYKDDPDILIEVQKWVAGLIKSGLL